jgi:hypothetical protein
MNLVEAKSNPTKMHLVQECQRSTKCSKQTKNLVKVEHDLTKLIDQRTTRVLQTRNQCADHVHFWARGAKTQQMLQGIIKEAKLYHQSSQSFKLGRDCMVIDQSMKARRIAHG